MYQEFFKFSELPFAIVPNPKFFFLSERHKEALSHMLSGISGGGGMALLTGEVGTGKTMTMRALISRLPIQSQVLTIINPALNELELLQVICDGFSLPYQMDDGFKDLLLKINDRLFENDAKGIDTILLLDEAQHLKAEVLELLRLLTNIETDDHKLLKVILIGQPELQQLLRRSSLRQLAQRITERYQLMPLPEDELKQYILHRLTCVGKLSPVFDDGCYRVFAQKTGGVPRLINLVCDQALKIAFREGKQYVNTKMAKQACSHVLEWQTNTKNTSKFDKKYFPYYLSGFGVASLTALLIFFASSNVVVDLFSNDENEIAKLQTTGKIQDKMQPALAQNEPLAIEVIPKVSTIDYFDLVEKSQNKEDALYNLYQQWGYVADEKAASCNRETRANLSCYSAEVKLEHILTINRPTLLVMNGGEGRVWYGLIYAVENGQYEIISGTEKQRFLVNENFIKQNWTGQAIILWRPPLNDPRALNIGQRNSRVRWLDERLNMVLGTGKDATNRFTLDVFNKVKEFQRIYGIEDDGIAGPLTIMTLDSALELPGPTIAKKLMTAKAQIASSNQGKIVKMKPADLDKIALIALPPYTPPVTVKNNAPVTKIQESKVAKTPAKNVKKTANTANAAKTENQTRVTTKGTTISPKPVNELAIGDEVVDINKLDLSDFSPTLAKKVESALIQMAKSSEKTESVKPTAQTYSDVENIYDLPPVLLSRLPTMDFQAHIYASDPTDRWIRVNNKNAKEGQNIAKDVLLRGIEPQQVVVQFEGRLIAIPALSSW